jgi:hypothetical protein
MAMRLKELQAVFRSSVNPMKDEELEHIMATMIEALKTKIDA